MYKIQRNQSVSVSVKEGLLRLIISGKLKPGDTLKEAEIAAQMGVSRGPVREAIVMLESEGFLEKSPYKNNIISRINLEEITRVFLPIRCQIEAYALEKFMAIAAPEHYKYLEYEIYNMDWANKENNTEKFIEADINFHQYLLESSQLQSLLPVWSSISNRIRTCFFAETQRLNNELSHVIEEHRKLLESIKSGDVGLAQEALLQHIYIHAVTDKP